jgi:hypothetical protein
MHSFQTSAFADALTKIVARPPSTDLSNEVKLFAVQSLTALLDLFPGSVNQVVAGGLLPALQLVLQTSFSFVDLTEAVVKVLEKIVLENPPSVLRSGCLGSLAQQMDFLDANTQAKIFKVLLQVARHSASEEDFDQHLAPLLPFLSEGLQNCSD